MLERARRRFSLRLFALPLVGWAFTAMTALALWGADLGALAFVFCGSLSIFLAQISRDAAARWREYKRAPARQLWRELTNDPRLLGSGSVKAVELKCSLRALYNADERGEVLPLFQAARLLVIYDLQQGRRKTILSRLVQLENIRDQLKEKVALLHDLGDHDAALGVGVEEMNDDIKVLEGLATDLLASCHRLEALVLGVHRAVQVKQLHREIAQLKSSVSSTSSVSDELAARSNTDIERQIGREIETFVRLERETDAHLRML